MLEVALTYGAGSFSFLYDENNWRILTPAATTARPLSDADIGAALDEPSGAPPLEEIVNAGDTALIVVSDATRATGSGQIVNLLVRRLLAAGLNPGDIRIIFATGIHRAVTPEEQRELLTPFIFQRIRAFNHNAHDPSQHILLGETARGTPIEVNRALTGHDHIILTGGIGWHYFAGFTGGRKSICPGLASARAIAATHQMALDFTTGGRRAGVGTGLLAGNAVHEECQEVAAHVAPSFLVNTHTDERGRVTGVYAGDWRAAHARACAAYAAAHSVEIMEKRPWVVVSCGGWPYDINLIQAHKALEMASYACVEGGTIIWLAECADGLGRADFLKWFDAADSRALAGALREHYEVNGQTAWTLLDKAERFRVVLVSKLETDDVARMRLIPARTLDEALRLTEPPASGYLMLHGAAVLPVISNGYHLSL